LSYGDHASYLHICALDTWNLFSNTDDMGLGQGKIAHFDTVDPPRIKSSNVKHIFFSGSYSSRWALIYRQKKKLQKSHWLVMKNFTGQEYPNSFEIAPNNDHLCLFR
jgi:hypothetical protein